MGDSSVRNTNDSGQRLADAVLRASGGYTALFVIPVLQGDATDAGQLGIDPPVFQELVIAPAAFRKLRPTLQENQKAKYELIVSASAVADQVSLLALSSADALFSLVARVIVSGLTLLVEEWSCSVSLSEALLYRLLLRVAETPSSTPESGGA